MNDTNLWFENEDLSLVDLVGEYLDHCIYEEESIPQGSAFEGYRVVFKPSFFAHRIAKYSKCSPCCLVFAIVYIERFL